jgi:uncharacterized membrane-anchored protein
MKLKQFIVCLSLLWICPLLFAQEPSRAQEIEKIEAGLKWFTGRVVLGNNLAEVNLTSDFRYLGPEDARKVIVDLWGNPPSRADTLGMIFPADVEPSEPASWGIVFTYREDGYVKDDDAAKINYDDMLKQMQEAVRRENEERIKQNFSKVELVGWASIRSRHAQTILGKGVRLCRWDGPYPELRRACAGQKGSLSNQCSSIDESIGRNSGAHARDHLDGEFPARQSLHRLPAR